LLNQERALTEVAQGGGFRRARQNIALPIHRPAKVDADNPERGPLLIISGEKDHTVPPAIAQASYKQRQDNQGVTEIIEIKNRGHAAGLNFSVGLGYAKVDEPA